MAATDANGVYEAIVGNLKGLLTKMEAPSDTGYITGPDGAALTNNPYMRNNAAGYIDFLENPSNRQRITQGIEAQIAKGEINLGDPNVIHNISERSLDHYLRMDYAGVIDEGSKEHLYDVIPSAVSNTRQKLNQPILPAQQQIQQQQQQGHSAMSKPDAPTPNSPQGSGASYPPMKEPATTGQTAQPGGSMAKETATLSNQQSPSLRPLNESVSHTAPAPATPAVTAPEASAGNPTAATTPATTNPMIEAGNAVSQTIPEAASAPAVAATSTTVPPVIPATATPPKIKFDAKTPVVEPIVKPTAAAATAAPVTPASAAGTANPPVAPVAGAAATAAASVTPDASAVVPPKRTFTAGQPINSKAPLNLDAAQRARSAEAAANIKNPNLAQKAATAVKDNASKGLAFVGAAAGKHPNVAIGVAAVAGIGGLWVTVKSLFGKGKVNEETGEIERPSVLKRAAGVVLGAAAVAGGVYLSKQAMVSSEATGKAFDTVRKWTSVVQNTGAPGVGPSVG